MTKGRGLGKTKERKKEKEEGGKIKEKRESKTTYMIEDNIYWYMLTIPTSIEIVTSFIRIYGYNNGIYIDLKAI